MLIAPAAPIAMIPHAGSLSRYHLILNRLVHSSGEYRKQYTRLLNVGHHIIYDNDSWEVGGSASLLKLIVGLDLLLDMASPDVATEGLEIVLPDALRDSAVTATRTEAALEALQRVFPGVAKFMHVPQGRTWDEWTESLKFHLSFLPHAIGVPRVIDELDGPRPILHALDLIGEYSSAHQRPEVHLLGIGRLSDYQGLGALADIRGVDTAKMYSWAITNQPFGSEVHRPHNYFEITLRPEAVATVADHFYALQRYLDQPVTEVAV